MLPVVTGEFRVVADPDLRFAPSGVAVGKIRAVASSRKKNEDGEWVDDKTCWVNLVCFKRLAENVAETFEKGDLVLVTGKLQPEDWEDKDGNKRTSVNIIVDTIGPSVTFNAARPMRGERSSNSGGNQSSGQAPAPSSDPWSTGNASDEPPF
jgi:single-strand DNA-binding protein